MSSTELFHQDASRRTAVMDRLGLWILGLLLFSPVVFKVRISGGIVIHPFVPLLIGAWFWVLYASTDTFSHRDRAWYVPEWQAWNVPLFLLGLCIAGLAFSLTLNSIWLRSLQSSGWLLLVKWFLYLAPLPLTTLLALRTGPRIIRVVSYMVPPVALITLLYSLFRLGEALAGRYINAYVDASSTFFAMGMFAEVLSPEGLVVRSDTGSHGAYGMYLAFVLTFSLCLAMFRGWNGMVHRSYAMIQGIVLCPLCFVGILLTGSRSSLILVMMALLALLTLLAVNHGGVIDRPRRLITAVLILIVPLGIVMFARSMGPTMPTIHRFQETLASSLEIERTARGDFSPMINDRRTERSVKNVQMRVWLWGQTVRYLTRHPSTMFIGIGYDRRRFVEEVVGVPYEGYNFNFQTAHNLFLDILVKGGIGPLIPLLAVCLWLVWVAVKGVMIPMQGTAAIARVGIGWTLISFWPALILVSFTCEEMFTDNLLLHWTMLFGLLLGLCGTALATWLPNRMVHVTATAGLGGGPAYITALARHQVSRGKKVRIFCSDEKPYVDIWRRMGIDVSALPMRRPNVSSMWLLLKELLRAPAPLHAHGRGAAFFAVWVKMLVRVPVIYTPHGPHYAYKRGYRYVTGWVFEVFCRLIFDAIVHVSAGERDVARRHRIPIGRSRVVVSGFVRESGTAPVYQSERDLLLDELNIPKNRFVIGWIGRFHYQKGLDLLLDSIPRAMEKVSEVVWLIIGEGSAQEMSACHDKIMTLGLEGKVIFLGARTDAFALIRAFDLYISTSRWEGLPLVLLEVMEQGVPIVASDVVGNRDVLEGWGVLYSPNDPCAAAEAQVRLAADESLRKRLVTTGREIRLTRFSLSRMLADMDLAYGEILGDEIAG